MAGADEAITRCVGDPAAFMREVWTRRPHCFRGADPSGWADVLTVADVDEQIGTGGLRYPALRIVEDGKTRPRSAYLGSHQTGGRRVADAVDPDAVLEAFGAGATLVMQGLHRFHRPVQRFCDELERFFGHPLQANAYLTPPASRGLAVHHDTHDVLVLQLHGAKEWSLYATDVPDPVGTFPKAKRHPSPGPATEKIRLEAGDCLYLPRGVPHSAEGVETSSLHLTLGVRSPTWLDVLERVMKDAPQIEDLRKALPPRYATHPGELEAGVASMLERAATWLRSRDPVAIAAAEAGRELARRGPARVGRLTALAAGSPVRDDTLVRRADEVPWRLELHGDHATLRAGASALRFPARVLPALETLMHAATLRPRDLAEFLDEAGRRVIVGRLLREGFVRLCEGAS